MNAIQRTAIALFVSATPVFSVAGERPAPEKSLSFEVSLSVQVRSTGDQLPPERRSTNVNLGPIDGAGQWRMFLPAGWIRPMALERIGEDQYRLTSGKSRFNGVYAFRNRSLVAVEPIETEQEGYVWKVRSRYLITLVEQADIDSDYRGAILFRARPEEVEQSSDAAKKSHNENGGPETREHAIDRPVAKLSSPSRETHDDKAPRQAVAAPNLTGQWLMTLPAGFEHGVDIESREGNCYRLEMRGSNNVLEGVYELRQRGNVRKLAVVRPDDERMTALTWKLLNANVLLLVKPQGDSPTGATYTNATLTRQVDAPKQEPGERRSAASARQAESQIFWEKVLQWLPPDTETLTVAKNVKIKPSPQDRGFSFVFLSKFLAVTPIPQALRGFLGEEEIAWSVRGGRNFETVSAFGTLRREAAVIIKLADSSRDDDLAKRLKSAAKEVTSIAGLDVYSLPLSADFMAQLDDVKPWQGRYVVLPAPGIIITATSDIYLKELLQRSSFGRSRTKRESPEDQVRALPATLPEWDCVDTTAEVWLLRHVPETGPQAEENIRDDGDQRLRGLAWWMMDEERSTFRAVYLPMPGHNVERIARQPWRDHETDQIPEALKPFLEFTADSQGAVTVTLGPRDAGTNEHTSAGWYDALKRPARGQLGYFALFYLGCSAGLWK